MPAMVPCPVGPGTEQGGRAGPAASFSIGMHRHGGVKLHLQISLLPDRADTGWHHTGSIGVTLVAQPHHRSALGLSAVS